MSFATGVSSAQTDGSQSFRTITLDEGETRTILVDDGETLENLLIDQRADGAHLRINTDGSADGFTIRNVGFLGVPQGEKHVMNLAGNGVVENVFIDGRERDGVRGTKMGGIRMKRGHSGQIEIRHTFIAGMGNNASYSSSAGKNGGGNGAVIFENCYHRDNTVSNYRPGTEGSRIRNCVSIVNDPDGLRGPYPHSGVRGSRGAWVKHWPDQRVENCAFYMSPDDYNPNETLEARHFDKSDGPGVEVAISNTGVNPDSPSGFNERSEDGGYARIHTDNVHDNPTVDVIQDGGIPLNPEMAASGLRAMPPAIDEPVPPGGIDSSDTSDGGSSGSTEMDTLTVDGTGADRTDYAFTVSGDLAENPDAGSLGTGDAIDGSTATGFVNGGVDGYLFSGDVTDMTVDGNATILVNGEAVDPASFGDSADDGSPTVSTTAATEVADTTATLNGSLDGLGGADAVDVAFEWRESGASAWNSTTAETVTATGSFTTELTELAGDTQYEYRATAAADDGDTATGSTVSFTTGSGGGSARTLTVDGTNADRTDYAFTVSGDLAENPDVGSLGTGDAIDGSTATGFVNGGVDGYLFSGDVTDMTVDGNATILVDGSEVDPASFDGSSDQDPSDNPDLPNRVVIDGSNSDRSDYSFTVDGQVEKSVEFGSNESDDAIDANGNVEGYVDGDVDGYVYSGDITSFSIDGGASVSFEDNDD